MKSIKVPVTVLIITLCVLQLKVKARDTGSAFTTFNDRSSAKPRIIATTDGEYDDRCSMIRFLLYANEWDVEGIIYSSSRFHWKGHDWAGTDWIQEDIDLYRQVYGNLTKHTPDYPSPDYLMSRVFVGNIDNVGEMTRETPGSNHIVDVLLDSEPGPVWLQAWGGTNTIARALKTIQEKYPEQMDEVSKKAIIYIILDQDETYENYIRPNWPDLPVLYSRDQFAAIAYNWSDIIPPPYHSYFERDWMMEHITRNHGPLCSNYPSEDFGSEGDTPAFLYNIPVGLRQMEHPTYGGWGGRFHLPDSSSAQWWGAEDTESIKEDTVDHFITGFDGTPQGALLFNPTESDWYRVDLGNFSPMQLGTAGEMTVTFWAHWHGSTGSYQDIINKRDDWATNGMVWGINQHASTGHILSVRQPESNADSEIRIPEGEWAHVAVTIDDSVASFYINGGALHDTQPYTPGSKYDAAIHVGTSPNGAVDAYNGALDDIRFYSRALTEQEIYSLYETNETTAESALIAHYRFDGNLTDAMGLSDGVIDDGDIYKPIYRWSDAFQNDFAARADWCIKGFDDANHRPEVRISGKLDRKVTPGSKVTLSAAGSTDPDGDNLSYQWWQYDSADAVDADISISNSTSRDNAGFIVPNSVGKDIHIILTITDDGTPNLQSYRRIIFEITER